MRFSQENIEGNSISAYASGRITVNGEAITRSVIITPERIIHDWLPAVFNEMEASHLERFGELDPEIILIGTGETLRFPPASWTAAYLARGIGVEFMDTAAACRTLAAGKFSTSNGMISTASNPSSAAWPQARGARSVTFLGMDVALDGTISLGGRKLRRLLRAWRLGTLPAASTVSMTSGLPSDFTDLKV